MKNQYNRRKSIVRRFFYVVNSKVCDNKYYYNLISNHEAA